MSLDILSEKWREYQSGMGKGKVEILFLGFLFALCITHLNVEAKPSSSLEREIEAKLKLLNKPAVKTIKSEDGDIIDCVDIYKQPVFDHPALKNHTIKMMPDFLLEFQNSSTKDGSESESVIFQTWQKSGSCPKGTVPIRRILKEDLLRADSSVDRFGQKPPAVFKNSTIGFNLNLTNSLFIPEHRSAAYLMTLGYNYIGAQADINVWNPKVDLPDDFTTAQIWAKSNNNQDFESVEAGWVVNPKLYGDRASRFFAYWTRDSYKSTGCFDLFCHGFVVTGQVALGAAIRPVSSRLGPQYVINVGMFLDTDAGNWYLKVKNNVPVGYWPKEILGTLTHSAIAVEFGGQVSSTNIKKQTPHTGTGMGSGDFAGRYGFSCFMQNVRIKDYSLSLKYPPHATPVAEEPFCYSTFNDARPGVEPMFYFGGPGRNPNHCP